MVWRYRIIYRKWYFGHRESFGVTRYCTGTTGRVPGGPPGGDTHPGGPHGLKWEGIQPIVGWCAPLGPPPAPRVETLGWGGAHHMPWGALHPLAAAPLGD